MNIGRKQNLIVIDNNVQAEQIQRNLITGGSIIVSVTNLMPTQNKLLVVYFEPIP